MKLASYPVYEVPAGRILPILFSTYASTGASVTLTGLAVTDIEVYKNGSPGQRASDNGYTLLDTDGIDFDGITGIHGFSVNTGDASVSGFYEVGSMYHVVVSSVTVDGQTVNFIAAAFWIVAPQAIPGYLSVNTVRWNGDVIPYPANPGVPEVDVAKWRGSEVQIPIVSGVPRVDTAYVMGDVLEEDSDTTTNWGAK